MNDTLQELMRDILREVGDTSARNNSKEMILRHVVREAAFIAARYPNTIRSEGSPSSGPTHEVTLTDLLGDVDLDSGIRFIPDKLWVNGQSLEQVNADDLEGVIE